MKKMIWMLMLCGMFLFMPTKIFAQEVTVTEEKVVSELTNELTQQVVNYDLGTEIETEYLSVEDAIVMLREQMVQRETEILLAVKTESYQEETFYYDLLMRAMEHTGNSVEGDYIRFHTSQITVEPYCEVIDGMNYVTLKYSISYFSSAEQEATMDTVLEEVMENLNLAGGTDYEKIKSIYDYIADNIVYDYDNKDCDSYTLKQSAYAALINKRCVCQGYANLFYRMALAAGVDCRIVDGISHGESHAWNIVCIDGNYYNVDCTWDAELSQMGSQYQYFLKSNNGFGDHTRNDVYMTADFVEKYPIARIDYGKDNYWTSYASYEFAAGKGTEEFPYQISTAQDLALMAYRINNDDSEAMYAYYQLTNDIDLGGHEWIPILDFYGTLDGQGYTISNMSIQYMSDYMCYGLIGYAQQAVVKNLCIEDCVIDVTERNNSDEGFYVYPIGVLIGKSNGCRVENCVVEGNVNFNVALYGTYLGSLLGSAANVTVNNSHASVDIVVISEQCVEIGGLIGNVENAEIHQSSYKGNIDMYANNGDPSEDGGWVAAAGGLIGGISWHTAIISDCYAIVNADLEATRELVMGGAFGYINLESGETLTLKNVYAVSEMNGKSMIGSTVSYGLIDSPGKISNVSGCFPSMRTTLRDCGYFVDDKLYIYENISEGEYANLNDTTEYSDAMSNIVTLFTEKMSYDTNVWNIANNKYPVVFGESQIKHIPGEYVPVGSLERVEGGDCTITVSGWAYDLDDEVTTVEIQVYVNDTLVVSDVADERRPDINETFGCGEYHGFNLTFDYVPEETGIYTVKVYALNTNTSFANTLLGNGTEKVVVTVGDNPFVDVKSVDYFYTPVLCALENSITLGTYPNHFSPNDVCTRGQIVTFLWRANGSPEPASMTNPFTDVASDAYYYKAVLWAVENGITAGYGSDTIFNPDGACTRGQVATFLWRAEGKLMLKTHSERRRLQPACSNPKRSETLP